MNDIHTITLELPFDETVERTRALLAENGFGVLTEIDVNATFAAKLGQEHADAIGDYLILGACNPPLSERALAADPGLGTLLPCNVVVRRTPGASSTTVQTVDPQMLADLSDASELQAVAHEVDTRLLRVIEGLRSAR